MGKKLFIKKGSSAYQIFLILLLGLFAMFSLMLVLAGTSAYRNITLKGTDSSDFRNAFSYVAVKVRSVNTSGAINIKELDGINTLSLTEDVGEDIYEILLYEYNGSLYEYSARSTMAFSPEAGEKILDIESFEALLDNDVLTISMTVGGISQELHLNVLSGEEY